MLKWNLVPALLSLLLLAAPSRAADVRTDTDLTNWKFLRADPVSSAAPPSAPAFDDAKWDAVTLPHTWNAKDGEDGGSNYYRGPAWYRTHLALTPDAAKAYYLYFDGAASAADVYVNGQKAGSHQGAFGAFCFDITPLLDPKGDNVIAVRVNNSRNPHIAPLNGDFNIWGGLYRNVHLLTRNKISISPIDDGIASPGIYLKQTSVTADKAVVDLTVLLKNHGVPPSSPCHVHWTLLDADHKPVQTGTIGETIVMQSVIPMTAKITIDHPHLWNGVKDPYLYSVQVDMDFNSKIFDSDTQPLGLRFFKCDPDQGFFLNGQPYALHGVNRHQDRQDKGWAVSPADHEEDYKLIADMGCTAVRLAHYEHAQHFYDLCDQGGMIVWAELCLVNDIDLSPEFAAVTKQQLTELIKQNFNHPSICFWSLYNELNFRNNDQPRTAFVANLNTIAHALDSTRLTVGANNHAPDYPTATITDVSAFNRYDGWYNNSPATWPATLDAIHKGMPTRASAVSEYGAGASVIQHEDNPAQPKTTGKWHPEEWQCTVHEAAWKAISERPWLWGSFLWCFADFGVDSRSEGDTPGRNDKGMVTYDRKTKKDVYFFYQANWTTAPMVHINNPVNMPAIPKTIKVYSNCDMVEFFAGKTSLGTRQARDHIFLWDISADAAKAGDGIFSLSAKGTAGDKTVTDACQWKIGPATQPALGVPK